jgi:hypothetical protein
MDKLTVDGLSFEFLHGSIISVVWVGELTEPAVHALREYTEAVAKRLGPDAVIKAIVDARAATGIDRAARKQLVELGREKHWQRAAFVGVGFTVKVLLELLAKALQLLSIENSEILFADTPEQALAWLERN